MALRGILDAIYWKMHTAYLRNKREEAKRLLGMIEGNDIELLGEIGPIHFQRFMSIRGRIRSGQFGRLYGDGSEAPALAEPPCRVEKSGSERAFCDALASREGRGFLSDACRIRANNILRELDLGEFGRVDFVIGEGRVRMATEVKMGEAGHSLLAQIDKYRLGLELDMINGLYDEVRAVVLAEHFPAYIASELSRLSVAMVLHRGTPESLRRVA